MCKREPGNTFDRYAVAVKKEGTIRTFASKGVAGVFAVFATGKYTVASVSVEHKHVECAHYDSHRNVSIIPCRKNLL